MLKINKIEISGQHVAFSVFVKCANSDQTHANQRYFADETCTYLLKRYWNDEFMWGITLITINKHTKSIEFSFTFLLPVWRRCSNNALWVMSLPRYENSHSDNIGKCRNAQFTFTSYRWHKFTHFQTFYPNIPSRTSIEYILLFLKIILRSCIHLYPMFAM